MMRLCRLSNIRLRIRTRACRILGVLLLAAAGMAPARGEEMDRLIAAVNGNVITELDLELARNMRAVIFYGAKRLPLSRSEEIGRMIERELMRQELASFSLTREDANKVDARLRSLREMHGGQAGLEAFLHTLGLQESELRAYVELESSILKFVSFRFRPFAAVTPEEVARYYEGPLTEQLRTAKVTRPPLGEVSSKIEEILREEKINAALDQWIGNIRRNSRIEYFFSDAESNPHD